MEADDTEVDPGQAPAVATDGLSDAAQDPVHDDTSSGANPE
jgi:hypothetical protein